MKRFSATSLIAACVIALASSSTVFAQSGDVERGQAVYTAQKCSVCHAIDGKGNKKLPLDDVGSKLSAEDIRAWIVTPKVMEAKLATKPKVPMKAYPNLPAADLDALVAYLSSLKKS